VGGGLREFAEARKPKKLVVEVSDDEEDDDVLMYDTASRAGGLGQQEGRCCSRA
jgi:hypothetical protein